MWLDVILGIIIVGCILWGIIKGGTREIFGIIGIIVGLVVGARFYIRLATLLPIKNLLIAKPISFIIIFSVIALLIYLIGLLVHKVMHFMGIGILDKILGLVLGGVKGSLISAIICFFITLFPNGENIVKGSKLYPIVLMELRILRTFLPNELRRKIKWRTPRESYKKIESKTYVQNYFT